MGIFGPTRQKFVTFLGADTASVLQCPKCEVLIEQSQPLRVVDYNEAKRRFRGNLLTGRIRYGYDDEALDRVIREADKQTTHKEKILFLRRKLDFMRGLAQDSMAYGGLSTLVAMKYGAKPSLSHLLFGHKGGMGGKLFSAAVDHHYRNFPLWGTITPEQEEHLIARLRIKPEEGRRCTKCGFKTPAYLNNKFCSECGNELALEAPRAL
jgi:hypothetical protein